MKKENAKRDVKREKRSNAPDEPARVYKPRTLTLKTVKEKRSSSEVVNYDSTNEFSKSNRRESPSNRSTNRNSFKAKRNSENDKPKAYQPRSWKRNDDGRGDGFERNEEKRSNSPRSGFWGRDDRKQNSPKVLKPKRFSEDKRNEYNAENSKAEKVVASNNDGLIRLNRFIANSGICSRREADEHIANGLVTVNGKVVTELGTKVHRDDEVLFKGKKITAERKVYILLNKPKDYITTVDDPHAKHTVMDLIRGACEERVYPVGRLDRNSTGVLLLTNDGDLTTRLTHPSFRKRKIYHVGLNRKVRPEDLEKILDGIELDGEKIEVDAVDYVNGSNGSEVGIEIHSGQNRVVRRIFESLGYKVNKLDRVYFAGLTKKNLPRGKWRFLTSKEINMLKMNRFY
jgi:23S rRNA pseudouridine2605 synthase